MAKVVLGIGTSHSPMISAPYELWEAHARGWDVRMTDLVGKDGKTYDYDSLLAQAGSALRAQADPTLFKERFDRCQAAIAQLSKALCETAPDVAIIVGDDQNEQLADDNMPAVLVYWGETILCKPRDLPAETPASNKAAAWAFGSETRDYPVAAAFGRHLVERLCEDEFDVAHSRRLPRSSGAGHAFSFVYTRIMNGAVVPHVPIMLNTYYPPNQPSPKRAYDLGQALRRAIDSWPSDARVAVIASGGLSHFVVNEDLDRGLLQAMKEHDGPALRALPREQLVAGSSEILNWVAAAGALDGLRMETVDYVPCYRSPAGTGIGAAFAVWR